MVNHDLDLVQIIAALEKASGEECRNGQKCHLPVATGFKTRIRARTIARYYRWVTLEYRSPRLMMALTVRTSTSHTLPSKCYCKHIFINRSAVVSIENNVFNCDYLHTCGVKSRSFEGKW